MVVGAGTVVGAVAGGAIVVVVTCSVTSVNELWLVGGAETSSTLWPQPTANNPANTVQNIPKRRDMTRNVP